jgi:hypothetical protein
MAIEVAAFEADLVSAGIYDSVEDITAENIAIK